jgi:D-arabinose 1-dehydrogenase-like Zn-dependent alcohol dehydrogenase
LLPPIAIKRDLTKYLASRKRGQSVNAGSGEVVAVHGIGGLGRLGIQYTPQMGFVTLALGRGKDPHGGEESLVES